jgi:TonB family protein
MAQETSIEGNTVSITFSTRKVMKRTLVVSLLFHLVILIGLQETFPVGWVVKPLKTYHVELLRPNIDPLKKENAELEEVKSEYKAPPLETEDTISLDTKDKKYMSYAKTIKAKLMQHWDDYPDDAWKNLIEGEVLVLFTLNRQGHLKEIRVLQPSRHEIFNGEATRTIRAAAPFPAFPGSITVTKLHIKANFIYKLTSGK